MNAVQKPARLRITLTFDQMFYAGCIGVMRMAENLAKGRRETHGSERTHSVWGRHIESCMAEYAFALLMGYEWGGKGIIYGPDIAGTKFEIRSTPIPMGPLCVHHEDPDDRIVWHVPGQLGSYEVVGWIKAKNAKRDEWWSDYYKKGRPAFWVHADDLHRPEAFGRELRHALPES